MAGEFHAMRREGKGPRALAMAACLIALSLAGCSPEAAEFQVQRVAKARNLSPVMCQTAARTIWPPFSRARSIKSRSEPASMVWRSST